MNPIAATTTTLWLDAWRIGTAIWWENAIDRTLADDVAQLVAALND